MTDTPAPVKPATPEATAKPGFFEPKWAVVAALALGLGVVVGVRVARLLSPPRLPAREDCPDCAKRKIAGAVPVAHDVQAVVDGRTLPSLPISMANVLDPLRVNRSLTLNGESAVAVEAVACVLESAGASAELASFSPTDL